TFTGGGSDGNFTAAHTATLDGLGVDGKGAHTHYEQLYISSIEPRARLLYRLYQTLPGPRHPAIGRDQAPRPGMTGRGRRKAHSAGAARDTSCAHTRPT